MRPTPLRLAAAIGGAALVAASFVWLEPISDALVGAAGCLVLVVVTVTDLERRIVPNRVVVPALVVSVIVRTALDPSLRWILAALGVGGLFLVFAVVYPAGMGMGDVKLAAFLGSWLGWQALTAVLLGSFAAFVPAIVVLVRGGRSARKLAIPFAPFLALGGVIALFAGPAIVDWYRSFAG
jgi:leader peptidase (prepilin peptidase)/N-methyltransferase